MRTGPHGSIVTILVTIGLCFSRQNAFALKGEVNDAKEEAATNSSGPLLSLDLPFVSFEVTFRHIAAGQTRVAATLLNTTTNSKRN
jgi:hypothetical protein